MLKVEGLDVFYGPIRALRDVSFAVGPGALVSLVGSNGAGKTTVLNAVSRLLRVTRGDILFEDRSILALEPESVVDLGIVHVPEGRRVFGRMTIEENLHLGAYTCRDEKAIRRNMERNYALFPILKERRGQFAATLSGGEQQMLAVARAIMAEPRLLMLDEPTMGLAPKFVEEILKTISEINRAGTTVLLVEQNAHAALELAETAYVVESGAITLKGRGSDLLRDDRVRRSYLGEID